ncbi:Cupredoxin [Artemisia annua]|uniref:Cupredoxin n=1 Tax=Artemisia annua TaxID=35608 RepID=A0A2U1PCE6_ARTAN|nr:Cupredoxin [Artemisia annua]
MKMLMVFAATAMLVDIAVAVDITVGRPNGGWDLSTDLSSWAASQTFSVGDNLDFQFISTHDVLEVTRENYDICGLGSPISTTVASPARFPLTAAGSRYFICGRAPTPQTTPPSSPTPPSNDPSGSSPPPPISGETADPPSSAITLKMTAGSILGGTHCSQGMKVQIDVVSTPSPPPPQSIPPPASTPPPPQSTPPPAPTPSPTPQTTPPKPTPTQTTPPSSPTPPTNGPSGSSPPPPISGETADPPSSAITLKMTTGSILGFWLFVMMLLSL